MNNPEVLVRELLHRKPIVVNPMLIKLCCSHTGAIFLAQAIYWETTMGKEFWKTYENSGDQPGWGEELYMSREVFEHARKKASKYINVVLKGQPARNFYSVRWDVLYEDLATLAQSANPDSNNPVRVQSSILEKPQTSMRETLQTSMRETPELYTESTQRIPEIEEQPSLLLAAIKETGLKLGLGLSSSLRSQWESTLTSLLKEVKVAFNVDDAKAESLIIASFKSQSLQESLSRIYWRKPEFLLQDWAQFIKKPRSNTLHQQYLDKLQRDFLEAERERGPWENREAMWATMLTRAALNPMDYPIPHMGLASATITGSSSMSHFAQESS